MRALDLLSVWGGCDKKTDEYYSWEVSAEIVPAVDHLLHRMGAYLDTERVPDWMH